MTTQSIPAPSTTLSSKPYGPESAAPDSEAKVHAREREQASDSDAFAAILEEQLAQLASAAPTNSAGAPDGGADTASDSNLPAARNSMIGQLDANRDGHIDNSEKESAIGLARAKASAGQDLILSEFTDIFVSDSLSKEEAEMIFARFDFDQDGRLSAQELEAAIRYIIQREEQKQAQREEATREAIREQVQAERGPNPIDSAGDFIDKAFSNRPDLDRDDEDALHDGPAAISTAAQIISNRPDPAPSINE